MPRTNSPRSSSSFASIFVVGGGLVASGAAYAQTSDPNDPVTVNVPGGASALIFNQLFNVGGVGDRDGTTTPDLREFDGSVGCGGTDTTGGIGGQALSNVINAALPGGPSIDDDELVENGTPDDPTDDDRGAARDLWRFCDNLTDIGGAWTFFNIDQRVEREQSAGLAPDELFAQIKQAALITRTQVRSVASRAKQMRLVALGYDREAQMANNGAVSVNLDHGVLDLDVARGLNAGDQGTSGNLSFWANARHIDIDASSTPQEIGNDTDGFGATVGLDYRFSDNFIGGVSIGISELDSEFERIMGNPTGESEVENSALQFIWSYFPNDQFYVSGVVGFSDLEFENTKFVPTADMDAAGATVFAPLDSAPEGSTEFINIVFGYDIRKDSVTITPYGRFEHLDTEIDGFVERSRSGDNTLSLTVEEQNNTSFTGTFGAQFAFPMDKESGVWTPYLLAELVKEFEDQSDTLRGFLTVIPDATFALAPAQTDEEYGYVGFGLSGQLRNGWAILLDYNSLVSYEALDSWQATFGFRKDL